MGTEGSFPEVKILGSEADHAPPVTAKVKKTSVYISISS
jgi:hypothetical protein